VNLPEAFVVHSSASRLRIRIPVRRGDVAYFARVRQAALKCPIEVIRPNAVTGSILFHGTGAQTEAVAAFGSDHDLYAIQPALPAVGLAGRVAAPLASCNGQIRTWSSGQLDLPGAFFILLLFTAIYEIAKGRFRTPPWYTAFWYAFGLFTKAVIDRDS
jgi:hypothetical protein